MKVSEVWEGSNDALINNLRTPFSPASLRFIRLIGARRFQGDHLGNGALHPFEDGIWTPDDLILARSGTSSDAEASRGLHGVGSSTGACWKSLNERAPAPLPVRTSCDAGAPWVGSTNGSVHQGTGPLQADAAIHITGR